MEAELPVEHAPGLGLRVLSGVRLTAPTVSPIISAVPRDISAIRANVSDPQVKGWTSHPPQRPATTSTPLQNL